MVAAVWRKGRVARGATVEVVRGRVVVVEVVVTTVVVARAVTFVTVGFFRSPPAAGSLFLLFVVSSRASRLRLVAAVEVLSTFAERARRPRAGLLSTLALTGPAPLSLSPSAAEPVRVARGAILSAFSSWRPRAVRAVGRRVCNKLGSVQSYNNAASLLTGMLDVDIASELT